MPMKERLRQILAAETALCGISEDATLHEFGLSPETHYDVLVVAPAWKPHKIMTAFDVEITCTQEHSYLSGYEVCDGARRIAWIQCSSGASSLIDELTICARLQFDKLVFVGAVGSLVPEIGLGALCTPSWSIAGTLANGYLLEDLRDYTPFGRVYPNDPTFVSQVQTLAAKRGFSLREAPVFCTDSIACEYAHLDFIKSFGVQLIEMETSSFYLLADLMEKPAIALLAVSDNSATGDPLVGRSEAQKQPYDRTRRQVIPQLILDIAAM